jgi:hypothetical protein
MLKESSDGLAHPFGHWEADTISLKMNHRSKKA